MVALILDGISREKKDDPLRFGVIGLGVGASSILPTLALSPFSELLAGADINSEVRARTCTALPSMRLYETAEALCKAQDLDAVWISTPNRLHASHAVYAAECGKHVIISKPMTTSLQDAARIIEAADRNKVKVIAGHSLGFSPAIRKMAKLAQPHERMGSLQVAQMMAFTDWMILPRTPEEVDSTLGGGLVQRQSPHQIDALRLLAGGVASSVKASVGEWMPQRRTPGFFAAFVTFASGAVGMVSHNGYGNFVMPEAIQWGSDVGISGNGVLERARARRAIIAGSMDEQAEKHAMRLGGTSPLFRREDQRKPWLPLHLGFTVVSCTGGDMRHSPYGIYLYDESGREELAVPDDGAWFGQSEVEELYAAVRNNVPLYRDGEWGMATLEISLAIEESAKSGREIHLTHQVPVRPGALI